MITISAHDLPDGQIRLVATRLVGGEIEVVADQVGRLDEIQRFAVQVIGMGALLDAVERAVEPATPVN